MPRRRSDGPPVWGAVGLIAVVVGVYFLDVGRGRAQDSTSGSRAAPEVTQLLDVLPPTVAAPEPPAAALVDPDRITVAVDAVNAAAADARGTISVVVLAPDGSTVLASRADEQLYTASLVKMQVVQQLFALDTAGAVRLTAGDLDLMRATLTSSADGAMSTLWSRYDGAALVRAGAAQFGLTGTRPPARAGQWGEAVTTAADTARFLADLDRHLAPEDAATMLEWLRGVTARGADGFDQRFGLVGDGTGGAAVKQGWMCCIGGQRQLHSAGVLADGTVVALLGQFPSSTSWAAARTALDRAAGSVVAVLV